jgi:hypothetical protein
MRSTSVLSSDGGWLSKNTLISLIQSYAGSCLSITIGPSLIASLVDSSGLIEGLDSFFNMTSSGVSALEEAIRAR